MVKFWRLHTDQYGVQVGGSRTRSLTRIAIAVLALATGLAAAPIAPAVAYDMIFPVVGENRYSDTFGAPRGGGRSHQGVDIMAEKMVPVVAVADGTVGWMHDERGGKCCAMELRHDDGWESWYIHLNNDTPGTDDGQGWGFADGITYGTHVRAGQLIGWVGDSGNAENTGPHLHFELHDPSGAVVNPTPHVDAAFRLDQPLPAEYTGYFWDDDLSLHAANIDAIADLGITRGCNPPANDMYCPTRSLTRGEITAFLRRTLGAPSAAEDYFADDGDNIFEGDINALAELGIAFGCTETDYCPDEELRRDEMAELLVRTFGYTNPEETDFFVDDEASLFEQSINKLRNNGITVGCNPPDSDRFCPDRSLTRAEMATFLARALEIGS